MSWYQSITNHYQIAITTVAARGTHKPASANTVSAVQGCPFKSAVYIVLKGNAQQYVGESGNVVNRFIMGMNKTEHGYTWPETGGSYRVHFFEVPDNKSFRKAIEIEVILLLRLHTGFWPVETSKADPFSQLTMADNKIDVSGTRAREIVDLLFSVEPEFKKSTPEQVTLLAAFDAAEARLDRR